MNAEEHPGLRVANTIAALHRAMDIAEDWADGPEPDLAAPFGDELDEPLMRAFIRTCGVSAANPEAAIVFGLHIGAALARMVDDPSFGLVATKD